jgi:hypothetical protein
MLCLLFNLVGIPKINLFLLESCECGGKIHSTPNIRHPAQSMQHSNFLDNSIYVSKQANSRPNRMRKYIIVCRK